jgi:hypothetical protein
MNGDETSDRAARAGHGFRISACPVVREKRAVSACNEGSPARESSPELLYVVARDPKSLFLYWDLNWTRLFAQAGISARQAHLRTYRGDGAVEGTQEINPFRGHCFAEVGAAGTEYYCELGSFEGAEWKSLIRSSTTATPEAGRSDDFTAEFAALPTHLNFQRLLDILGGAHLDRTTLARSVAQLQANARGLKAKIALDELNGANANGTNGADAADLSALVEMALRCAASAIPTAEELARWKEFGERYGGSSWGGASKGGFGESSPA